MLDVTTLDVASVDGELQFEVMSVAGDGFLGGDDFDERLMHWMLDGAEYESASPLLRDTTTLGRFLEAAIELKHGLSSRVTANCYLRHLPTTAGIPVDFTATISRELLSELCSDLFAVIPQPKRTSAKGWCTPLEMGAELLRSLPDQRDDRPFRQDGCEVQLHSVA
jgi:molecular chaperone DnaK